MKMVKVEESYQTANIDEKNQKVLGSLRKNLEENISQALTNNDLKLTGNFNFFKLTFVR
jgi:hypothetical protein